MEKLNSITIQKNELPELEKWAKEKSKIISKRIHLKNSALRVLIEGK
ncbi:MAG: hypothetical protein NTX24_00700 [Candidatus Pacearchaeota archaeon]|nr:hypothetical protein [Candidatus Pacearchaeota archaeon]